MENKNSQKLPEGYIPLEYIEYRPKQEQLYVYGRYEKYHDALAVFDLIKEKCKDVECGIITQPIFSGSPNPEDVAFRVIFSEKAFNDIDFIRKDDCEIFIPPINITYNTPILYRFIEEKYIDSFFETGELKLTTFEQCKALEDANRSDVNEGRSLLYGYDGEYKIQFDVGVGSDAIMLCTSLCNSYTNDKRVSFSQSLEIFNVNGLIIAISEQLQSKGYKVRSIFHGSCFYAEKEFHQVIDSENFRKKLDKGVFDYDEMTKINQSISGYNIYFQKAVEKRMENEYRMIWLVDELKEGENLMVTIQNPEKYCRKIKAI